MLAKTSVRLLSRSNQFMPRLCSTVKGAPRLVSDLVRLPHSGLSFELVRANDMDYYLDQAINNSSPEPFGVVTWGSSFVASNFLDEQFYTGKLFAPIRVCELGCGTGLASFTCYLHGANVLATDYCPSALELCALTYKTLRNAPTSTRHGLIELQMLDINDPTSIPSCDLLVISDVMYYDDLATAAARCVHFARANYGAKILVADPGRPTIRRFIDSLSKLCLADSACNIPLSQISFTEVNHGNGKKGYYLWIEH